MRERERARESERERGESETIGYDPVDIDARVKRGVEGTGGHQ